MAGLLACWSGLNSLGTLRNIRIANIDKESTLAARSCGGVENGGVRRATDEPDELIVEHSDAS